MNEATLKGEIIFSQACLPPLASGDYTIEVNQTLASVGNSDNTFNQKLHFSAAGPRFTLTPADIYSTFPPAGQTGRFDNTLPHIVLARRTLPWERTLDGQPQDSAAPCPWMALLILSPSDSSDRKFPTIQACKVSDLLNPGEDIRGPQGLSLQVYESPDELCNTIDLSSDLLKKIVPSKADLPYLAHVRSVNTDNKETLSYLSEGCFSVVLANRFPESASGEIGARNMACLVSLEGFEDCLYSHEISEKKVRLAVLASWFFTCRGENDFKALMTDLDDGKQGASGLLSLSSAKQRARGDSKGRGHNEAAEMVRQAFERGYSGLNHSMRIGEKTVSWYRGPLIPLDVDKLQQYRFFPCADAALRYDPNYGLLETGYAAAWQLGRLLALQNRHFAQAMYRYRKAVAQRIAMTIREEKTKRMFGVTSDETSSNFLEAQTLTTLRGLKELKCSETSGKGRHPWPDSHSKEVTTDEFTSRLAEDTDTGVPDEVSEWLGRSLLLYGIPFNYLVPDERMLPPESIRFFYLDPGWLKCVIEGASSVGRSSTREETVDRYLINAILGRVPSAAASIRQAAQTDKTDAVDFNWPLTGYLLRSQVVEGWQGLEMSATGVDVNGAVIDPLPPLRIDRLSPDIMLCLFNGKVTRLEVKQPPEGMHFGASPDNGAYRRLSLRKVLPGNEMGDQIVLGAADPYNLPMRTGGNRVVDVAELKNTLETRLRNKNGMGADSKFTSAEFALQMVESPGKVIFTPKGGGGQHDG